ncbi:MAG: putative ABC transporter permease [Dysosmobacter sp.]
MHLYTTGQWVLLFFFYCFCGWVWECCYVSLRQRRWVNRGFLHGPVLPIYGSGAIIILFVTLPVSRTCVWYFFWAQQPPRRWSTSPAR